MNTLSRLFRKPTHRIELDLTDAQIVQLRAVMDGLPLNPYVGLVMTVLKALPLDHESAAEPNGAGADPVPVTPSREPGGFFMGACTEKGKAGLAAVERALSRIPHGGRGEL